MNYTTKYHLPQWEETDRIMRTDFNQMCADLEDGITEAKETADSAAVEAAKLPYVVGTYVGTGERNRHFSLGFRPSFIIVGSLLEQTGLDTGADHFFAISCGGLLPTHLKLTEDGFTVNCNNTIAYPDLNHLDFTYDYIAFH